MTPKPITAAPTSEDSFAVRPAPYALFYTLAAGGVDPSDDDLAQLAEVTRIFLETYMEEKYAQTSIILLDDFLTFLTRPPVDPSARPVEAVYRSVARFNPRSIFYPPRAEISAEIETAFTDPDSNLMYMAALKLLPSGNPFSQVEKVDYGEPVISAAAGRTRTFASAGIGAAAAGVIILAAGIILLRRQEEEGEEEKDANSVKKLYADNLKSVSDETTNTSTDSWRPPSIGINEDELQDEPLDTDSDDEQHRSKLDGSY